MNMKGSLPFLILHILSLSPSHGYGIAKEIKRRSGGSLAFAEGTIYPTLHDLEAQGLVVASEEEVRGRTRRYYQLTSDGQKALAREHAEWQQFSLGVSRILGEQA
ncbi:MAG: helix-turn-helix transcriptional regulator [Anaerolineaceae bacterium]|nr:helix-turn-helix transcriptional regulator [Anaerolineaceae bacterium]